MDWQGHFGDVFFKTWQKAGLPHHHDYTDEYVEARSGIGLKNDWIIQPDKFSPALHVNLLRSVYGFGALQGKLFSELFNLNYAQLEVASDWCGRFNLGISLFDYLCDEEVNSLNDVTSLKVFQPFINTKTAEQFPISPTEEYLNILTASVLQDLEKLNLKNEEFKESKHILKLMKQLFDAQSFLLKEQLSGSVDLEKIKKALYLKSAGPFKVMAAYTIGLSSTNDPLLLKNAHSISKAIGYCYWLIDDAKDVWIDLEAKQWNLLLQLAATKDHHIFSKNNGSSIKEKVTYILFTENYAKKLSEQVVKRLVTSLSKFELSKNVEEHTLGLLFAALWYWYK